MKTIVEVLKEIKAKHPARALTDGRSLWKVEELLSRADEDLQVGDPEAARPIYFWGYTADNRISVAKVSPEFGTYTILTEPAPGIIGVPPSDFLPILVTSEAPQRKRKRKRKR